MTILYTFSVSHYSKSLDLDDAYWRDATIIMIIMNAPCRIDKSTIINETGIVIIKLACRQKTPRTRLKIKIAFYFRLIGNTKNTSFHDLDYTDR